MVDKIIDVTVDPDGIFKRAIEEAYQRVGDLTIPLREISRRWYKSNQSIFKLKGPGLYEDLSPKYKAIKSKKYGFVYPILMGKNGRIKNAITKSGDENAVHFITNKTTLVLGVQKTKSFPYPAAHHLGSSNQNLPPRPFLFTGAEQIRPKGHEKAKEIYIQILSDYVKQVTTGKI